MTRVRIAVACLLIVCGIGSMRAQLMAPFVEPAEKCGESELRAALIEVEPVLEGSNDSRWVQAVNLPQSVRLRQQADGMDKRDAAIGKVRALVKCLNGEKPTRIIQGNASTSTPDAVPVDATVAWPSIASPSVSLLTAKSRRDLLKLLGSLPPTSLHLIGYVDEKGNVRALSASDLQMDVKGRLRTSK